MPGAHNRHFHRLVLQELVARPSLHTEQVVGRTLGLLSQGEGLCRAAADLGGADVAHHQLVSRLADVSSEVLGQVGGRGLGRAC